MKERFLILGTATWFIANTVLLVFAPDLANVFFLLGYGLQLLVLLLAVFLLVLAVFRVRRSPLTAVVCVLLIAGGLVFSFTMGRSWGERTRFALVRASYEKRLEEILESFQHGTPMPLHSAEYEIEPGPPIRVAFRWQLGVTDNWVGLVYDPTGMVMKANAFKRDWSNWKDPALEPVKRLFGGDIFQTRHLKDNWYLCSFT
jgi:hypothetical protein